MSISGVNGIGATAYAYMNSSMKTTGEGKWGIYWRSIWQNA